jgi:hypothetical protein
MHYVVGSVVGFLVGVFAPGVARKVKALFVKESAKGISLAEIEVKKVESKL